MIAPGAQRRADLLRDWAFLLLLAAALWAVNLIWLARDTRPPVWDMALHQTYALNFLPGTGAAGAGGLTDLSGVYPPFVYAVIAFFYLVLHPGPHVAVLANVPATILLLWALFDLAAGLAGRGAARWACFLTVVIPYLVWMSRETILDFWLAAWVAAALALLRRSGGFEKRRVSLLFGAVLALGMLTKWIFAGFLFFPIAYVFVRHRLWRFPERMVRLADALLVAGLAAGVWYLPSLPKLTRFFVENARIGAREGEPPVFSLQSWIYYLRLLEGYQLFGILFALLLIAAAAVWKKHLLKDPGFLLSAVAGGWLAMTLLRTKDPRFTMPLLAPLAIVPGAWIQSWGKTRLSRAAGAALAVLLCFQVYVVNFGVDWLPQQVILARGYQGSLRWDWNLYMQHYFHILGAPRREDWKQDEILRRIAADAAEKGVEPSLALIPDLARFNSSNFQLYARLRDLKIRVGHLQSASAGIRSFDGYNYVVMTEREQGMSWSTTESAALNKIVVDESRIFRLMDLYPLPGGNYARLYFVERTGG